MTYAASTDFLRIRQQANDVRVGGLTRAGAEDVALYKVYPWTRLGILVLNQD